MECGDDGGNHNHRPEFFEKFFNHSHFKIHYNKHLLSLVRRYFHWLFLTGDFIFNLLFYSERVKTLVFKLRMSIDPRSEEERRTAFMP